MRLNEKNCPVFKQGLVDNYDTLKNLTKDFEQNFFPRLAHIFGYCGIGLAEAVEMCQYLQWADLHNIKLTVPYTQDDLDQCSGLDVAMFEYFNFVDESLNHIAA
jgi:hypothetical protein